MLVTSAVTMVFAQPKAHALKMMTAQAVKHVKAVLAWNQGAAPQQPTAWAIEFAQRVCVKRPAVKQAVATMKPVGMMASARTPQQRNVPPMETALVNRFATLVNVLKHQAVRATQLWIVWAPESVRAISVRTAAPTTILVRRARCATPRAFAKWASVAAPLRTVQALRTAPRASVPN